MMSCERGNKGTNMSHEVFAKAIKLAERYDEFITIGGGEPTIHKHFFDFLDFALRSQSNRKLQGIHVITNGGLTKKALKLLEYSERCDPEDFSCQLSLDDFHSPISDKVENAYRNAGKHFIRSVDASKIIYMGSAKKNNLTTNNKTESCHCEDIFITPEGDMKICACEDAEILGNILTMTDEEYDGIMELRWKTRDENEDDVCHSTISEEQRAQFKAITQTEHVAVAA